MDDDLMDPVAVKQLPKPYRNLVRQQALRQRRVLEEVCDEFWVSTPLLGSKYREWQPTVLSPRPALPSIPEPEPPLWVCYHGSASHQAELDWLLELMQQVQAANSSLRFEVFGDHAVYKRFRELPRVSVLHPMTWPNYLDYTAAVQRQIALAPLIPNRFNAARGPTKFLDFTRMGAVGIYTDVEPYRGFIRHGIDGLLLPNDPQLWLEAILELTVNPGVRERIGAAARTRTLDMVG